ncbi:UNKNOWN [Stylonychia lemnae]|uniref:Uncharacterized protein n=1 Tax=Stylonychia lemnae TaxID=5949 RepID=A0A078A318_STYLE|nr:UNKNOWN [Stylonychia lemnae]|eukprot:CDW75888.1 UNKNOWN [Stylonychia lemnae]
MTIIKQDNGFPSEEVEKCVQDSVEQVLANAQWDEKMVPQWINDICEKAMKQLTELNRPYKFMISCMLMQKTQQSGAQTVLSCSWENNTDGKIVKFVYELNIGYYQMVYPPQRAKDSAQKTIQCIATVFCVRF